MIADLERCLRISSHAPKSSPHRVNFGRPSGVYLAYDGEIKMAAKFKLGDKVRSLGGVEGEVVRLNDDRRSVAVQVPGEWAGAGIVSIPMVRLRPIAEYSLEESDKRRSPGNLFPRLLA